MRAGYCPVLAAGSVTTARTGTGRWESRAGRGPSRLLVFPGLAGHPPSRRSGPAGTPAGPAGPIRPARRALRYVTDPAPDRPAATVARGRGRRRNPTRQPNRAGPPAVPVGLVELRSTLCTPVCLSRPGLSRRTRRRTGNRAPCTNPCCTRSSTSGRWSYFRSSSVSHMLSPSDNSTPDSTGPAS